MRPPLVLTLSGSHADGASGLQADLKTFTALGVYGAGVATQIVAAGPHGVRSVHPLAGTVVRAQLDAVLEDLRIDVVKVGALGSADVAEVVADVLTRHRDRAAQVVVDPVMLDSDGTPLISAEGARVLAERIVPLATVLTPSMSEAAQLTGTPVATSIDGMRDQALALAARGPRAVMVTGGRLPAEDDAVDVLVHPGGTDLLRAPRVPGRRVRGAGATLSAAIAAQLARIAEFDRAGELGEIGRAGEQDDLATVIATAREFVAGATEFGAAWEITRESGGRQVLNHLITLGRD